MLTENNIKCFISVATTLSFTKSAKEMFVTQQACSKTIKHLENYLGFLLFDRSDNNIRLTDAGKKMLQFFLQAEGDFQTLLHECRENVKLKTLRMGIMNYMGAKALIPILDRLHSSGGCNLEPDIKSAEPLQLMEMLRDGILDLAIIRDLSSCDSRWMENTNVHRRKMMESRFMISISRRSPLLRNGMDKIVFSEGTCVALRYYGQKYDEAETQVIEDLKRVGIENGHVRVFDNIVDGLLAVRLGQCYLLRDDMVDEASNDLTFAIPIGEEKRPIYCYYYDKKDPVIMRCVDLLCADDK